MLRHEQEPLQIDAAHEHRHAQGGRRGERAGVLMPRVEDVRGHLERRDVGVGRESRRRPRPVVARHAHSPQPAAVAQGHERVEVHRVGLPVEEHQRQAVEVEPAPRLGHRRLDGPQGERR